MTLCRPRQILFVRTTNITIISVFFASIGGHCIFITHDVLLSESPRSAHCLLLLLSDLPQALVSRQGATSPVCQRLKGLERIRHLMNFITKRDGEFTHPLSFPNIQGDSRASWSCMDKPERDLGNIDVATKPIPTIKILATLWYKVFLMIFNMS